MGTIYRTTVPEAYEPIYIIREGENNVGSVVFDLTWLSQNYGSGTASVNFRRSRDKEAYTVNASQSGNVLTWTLTDADKTYNGKGKAEVKWMVGNNVAKVVPFDVYVSQSGDYMGRFDATPSDGSLNPVTSNGIYDYVNAHSGGGGGDLFIVKVFDAEGSGEYSFLTDADDIAAAIQARKALFVAVGGTDEGTEWWTGPYPAEGEVEPDESGSPAAFQINVASTTSASNANGKLSLTFADIMIQHNFSDPTEDSITIDFPTYKVTLA